MILLRKISTWFYIGLLVWMEIMVLRRFHIVIPVINNHLTDLYTVPMYCYTIQFLMNEVFRYKWKQDLKFILWSTFYISIIFEVLGPLASVKFTGDLLDCVCYLVGGLLYFYTQKFAFHSALRTNRSNS